MRLRRPLAGVALLAATALVVSACGDDASSDEESATDEATEESTDEAAAGDFPEDSTMAAIVEAGELRVGTKFDQPGFGLANLDGVPEGFDVEIAQIIAADLGLSEDQITYTETPSAVREEVLEQGQVDLVAATYTINDERRERITFAGPYYVAGQSLLVAGDDDTITGPEDLADESIRVCSVDGSTPSENIRQFLATDDQLVLFDVYSKCADALLNDQVDVITTDNVILLGLAAEADEGAFKLVGDTFTDEPYGIGITKGDVEFCEFINESLAAAVEDGSYAEAWASTAGEIEGAQDPVLPEPDPCS